MFGIHVDSGSMVVCKPTGDLDWMAACAFRRAAHGALRSGVDVLIDLSDGEEVDSMGLSALLGVVRRARAMGGSARVVNVAPAVRRKMELADIYEVLTGRGTRQQDDVTRVDNCLGILQLAAMSQWS